MIAAVFLFILVVGGSTAFVAWLRAWARPAHHVMPTTPRRPRRRQP